MIFLRFTKVGKVTHARVDACFQPFASCDVACASVEGSARINDLHICAALCNHNADAYGGQHARTLSKAPQGAIHIAFGISRSDSPVWEDWLGQLGIAIESRKRWGYSGEALYFRDPDGHLLEVVTPAVWEVY